MKSKRLTFSIPIMIVVWFVAMWMLNSGYEEIQYSIRLMIAIGAVIVSGVISYFLFPDHEGKKDSGK
ncbi:histidine kinase [Robertmurraya andreesenii]|uniref:Histidine kinase n=1 Tax=Anoxybacillus andreesenii TaxID=1325932 RepID=A0ABT9V0P1_9BACL|nr:histidine kinase [Robertmurraya andreesenii]MDQ0154472.1 hypothetical protein [Robertmurraya andreesenii]